MTLARSDKGLERILDATTQQASQFLNVHHICPHLVCSFLFLVVRPGAPSSFLFLVVRPGASHPTTRIPRTANCRRESVVFVTTPRFLQNTLSSRLSFYSTRLQCWLSRRHGPWGRVGRWTKVGWSTPLICVFRADDGLVGTEEDIVFVAKPRHLVGLMGWERFSH